MQPPIDLTQTFRRELQKRQRQAIITIMLNSIAGIGLVMLFLLGMFSIGGLFAMNLDQPSILLIPLVVIWGAFGLYWFAFK